MPQRQRIHLSPSGLGVGGAAGGVVWGCAWDEVAEIIAWKQDAYIDDVICLGFRTSDAPGYLLAHEEMDGWDELIAALRYQYGIRLEDWFDRVAYLAFRENRTVLWARRTPANGGAKQQAL
jgi:hypothetical protein